MTKFGIAAGRRTILGLGMAVVASDGARRAKAQAAAGFPDRPVRLVIPYPPGGPTDQVMRAIAEAAQRPIGQAIVVENRGGASGIMGAQLLSTGARPAVDYPHSAISAASAAPIVMSVRRERPRHMTVLPGGGSRARARWPPSRATLSR